MWYAEFTDGWQANYGAFVGHELHRVQVMDEIPLTGPIDGVTTYELWNDPYESFNGHPRTSGTHGRVLRMGRENGVPLMHTLWQLSHWSAKHLGDAGIEAIRVRGRMQEGMVADITIFDPETVTDHTDYALGTSGDRLFPGVGLHPSLLPS